MRIVVSLLLLIAGCAGATTSGSMDPGSPSRSPSAALSSVDSPLVGEWVGAYDCDAIVGALLSAGFDQSVVLDNVVGNGLVPGAESHDDLADPSNPCSDAVAVEHGHFFTADGRFGSRDPEGNQVDEGIFEIVDNDTLLINGVEFGYSVEGDDLVLESVPEGCIDDECIWSIMVSMPGTTMHRQD